MSDSKDNHHNNSGNNNSSNVEENADKSNSNHVHKEQYLEPTYENNLPSYLEATTIQSTYMLSHIANASKSRTVPNHRSQSNF